MIKVCYSELDGPKGLSLRLEAAGHAGYAPAGQDIVCAGASTLMQALVYLLAGEESARSDAWDEPEGPRLAVAAQAPVAPWVQGAFELAKAGFTLLAERYPDNLRFADVSRSGQQSMMDLQLFAEGEAAPALSPEQSRQAVAAGTLKPEAPAAQPEVPPQTPAEPEKQPEMWSQELFNRLYVLLNEGGILTTYCAKGVIRRMLQAAGFTVERLPGPPGGKREILRARKLEQNQPPILIQ